MTYAKVLGTVLAFTKCLINVLMLRKKLCFAFVLESWNLFLSHSPVTRR